MPSYSRTIPIPGKSAQELYDKVAVDIDRFLEKGSIGKCEIRRDPAGRIVEAKGSMFSATLSCLEGAIQVDAKLSLLAAPFKGKIDEGIQKWLTRAFSPRPA